MSFLERGKEYAPIFVRYGVGIVFLLFGIDQTFSPESWFSWLPIWTLDLPISQLTFITVLGIFNLIVGVLLIVGFLTRIAALLGSLHLLGVIISLGYNDISIRDFGLFLASLSIIFHGEDKWCLSNRLRRHQF